MSEKNPKLAEIAGRINEHLKRLERLNTKMRDGKRARFYYASAYAAGSRVSICYISYQGRHCLTKDQAVRYLAALDAGSIDRHFDALRDAI